MAKPKLPYPKKAQGATVPIRAEMGVPIAASTFVRGCSSSQGTAFSLGGTISLAPRLLAAS